MNIRASRGRACGRSASPWASSCCLVGFAMSWWIVGARRRHRRRVRGPLGARHRRRARARRAPGRRRAGAAPRGGSRRELEPQAAEAESYTREKFLEVDDARSRRGDRRLVTVPVLGFMVLALVPEPGQQGPRSRAAPPLPRGRVARSRPSRPSRRRATSRASPSSSATTALARAPAELHDPLQPLRPPRLPGAAERAPSASPRRRRTGT